MSEKIYFKIGEVAGRFDVNPSLIRYWEQEFEAEFLGSTNTLIHSSILRNMSGDVPILDTGDRQVYEFPKAGHKYNICVDVSRGLQLDYSAFNIMDVTESEVVRSLEYHQSQLMIHGHTHRPNTHDINVNNKPAQRIVVGDWYEQGSYLIVTPEKTKLINMTLAES